MARLGETLVERGLVRPEALEAALHVQRITHEKLGGILVRNGALRYADLLEVLAGEAPSALGSEQATAVAVPAEEMRRHRIAVTAVHDGVVYAATLGRQSVAATIIRRHYPGHDIHWAPIKVSDLDQVIGRQIVLQRKKLAAAGEGSLPGEGVDLVGLLTDAVRARASDLHLEPEMSAAMIYQRIDGVRHPVSAMSMNEYNKLLAALKDRGRMDVAETRLPQDGALDLTIDGRMISFRLSSVPETGGEKMVIRVLDPDAARPRLEDLGITRLDDWMSAIRRKSGLVLIVGPTGSGKTTTLNSTIGALDKHGLSIYSAEDPVEYALPGVTQVSINEAVGLTFARALRSFMRSDPDVILIGEIRDKETADIAVHASKTGHLVIATVHADTVPDAVGRLADLGADTADLARQLRGVLVQRLVRTTHEGCGGRGCDDCKGGYHGRTIVSECVSFHSEDEVRRMREGERWWPTLVEDAIGKAEAGITTMRELQREFGAGLGRGREDVVVKAA